MSKRNLRLEDYNISNKRYKELCGFCEQYPEWKHFLDSKVDTLASPQITDMPIPPHNNSDKTGDLAVKRADLQNRCSLIERIAKETDDYLAEFIIQSVCYESPITYLQQIQNMHCSKSAFYRKRRYFFYLLDKEKS